MSSNKLDDTGVMEFTRNIMIVSIIALFVVMSFVVFIHLYSKWYWYRRPQDTNLPNNSRRRDCHQGLDASFLKTIAVIHFDPNDFKEGLECAVCLSELEQGEKARILPKCDHGFHVECIDMWFHTHSTCPICRNPVSLTQEESTDGGDSQNSNVLLWGDETEEANNHIQTPALPSEQASSSSSPSMGTDKNRARPDLVIDIPRQANEDEDEKTPVSRSGIRSLKRILSGSRGFNPFSPGTGSSNV